MVPLTISDKSYLSNHKQFVEINGSRSTWEDVTCGVLQGSVLTSLLFIISLFDLFKQGFNVKLLLYADDTAFKYKTSPLDESKKLMQADLDL